jgi:predicted Fe-Mo cluster-binding NifX family protein
MKFAVMSTGPTMEHFVAGSETHAVSIIYVDSATMRHHSTRNDPKLLQSRLGKVLFAKLLAQEGVEALLTGQCNSELLVALNNEGIEVVSGVAGFVSRAVSSYKLTEVAPSLTSAG